MKNMLKDLLLQLKEIEDQLVPLNEKRESIRQQIIDCMKQSGTEKESAKLGDTVFFLKKRTVSKVSYSEELLRQRLGDRYKNILDIDSKKLKKNSDQVLNLLGDAILQVGSVSKDKVKAAIDAGVVSVSDFDGAFEKTVKDYLTVVKKEDCNVELR